MRSYFLMFLLIFCTNTYADYAQINTPAGREHLKDYGLAHCIHGQFSQNSPLYKDIEWSAYIYSLMVDQSYTVDSNKITVTAPYDPYTAINTYFSTAYAKTQAESRPDDNESVLKVCLDVYNSKELDTFVKTQDKYNLSEVCRTKPIPHSVFKMFYVCQ